MKLCYKICIRMNKIKHEARDYLNILFGTTVRMITNIKTVVPRHKENKCYIFHCAAYGFLALNSSRRTHYEVTFHDVQCLIFKTSIFSHDLFQQVSNSGCKALETELQNLLNCFSKEYLHKVALLSVTSVIAVWKHIVWMICTVSHYCCKFLSILFIWDLAFLHSERFYGIWGFLCFFPSHSLAVYNLYRVQH